MAHHSILTILRAATVALTSLGLLTAPMTQAFAATTFGNLKTPQQFRADAARYDESVKAIQSIASMRIATPAELNSAVAILQKHSPNLRLSASRLVALGYDDRRFATAIAANLTNERLAVDFARRLAADHTIAARLDGATELRARMAALIKANAAALQSAIDQLQAATLRITGKSPGVRPKFLALPPPTIWTPSSNIVLAAIAFTFPSIAANAPVLQQPATGTPSTTPTVPSATAIAAYLAALAQRAAQQTLGDAFESQRLVQELFEDVREAIAEAERMAIDACIERMRVVFEQCLADIPKSAPAEYGKAKSACELGFQVDRAMCSSMPSYGTTDSSLFPPGFPY